MANSTDPLAKNIRGTNPLNLVEKTVRTKIHNHTFWKEQCFGFTAETLIDKSMEFDHVGGTFGGNRKPTPFLCLVLKVLQIQHEKEIAMEFIKKDDYKNMSKSRYWRSRRSSIAQAHDSLLRDPLKGDKYIKLYSFHYLINGFDVFTLQ